MAKSVKGSGLNRDEQQNKWSSKKPLGIQLKYQNDISSKD